MMFKSCGKLVHPGRTQETSHGEDPRIFFSGFNRSALFLRIYDHRTEFIDTEHFSVFRQAVLHIKYRSLIGIPDQERDKQEKRTRYDQHRPRYDQILQSFYHSLIPGETTVIS